MRSVLADPHRPKAGRPLWWVAGLSLSLLLVAGLLAWVVLDERGYVAPTPGSSAATASPAAADAVLGELAEALDRGDPEAAAALAPPGEESTARLLADLARNAAAVRVRELSLGYVSELGGVADDGSWTAAVDVTWAFGGFDRTASLTEVRVTFRQVGGTVFVAAVGGGDGRTPVWLAGPLEVRRTARTLVLVEGSAREADRIARVAEKAVPVVRRVLPDTRPRLVVEVPATAAALHRALGADPGTYARIAAVTTSPDGSSAPEAPVHVFVNPAVFGGLQPRGAQVVMSHEAVHVATGAATSADLPLWLLEGFADYVALRDVPLSLSVTAAQVIRQVRRQGLPDSLPGPEAFDTRTPRLGASYEAAWLACRLLARRGGDPALVRLYRAVDAGDPLERALRRHFGIGVDRLTREWRALLEDLAG